MASATAHKRRNTRVEDISCSPVSTLQLAASRMTITAWCRAEDDEQFRRKAQPSIVLNEGGDEGGSVGEPTPKASRE
jgi:hypothetical protein